MDFPQKKKTYICPFAIKLDAAFNFLEYTLVCMTVINLQASLIA